MAEPFKNLFNKKIIRAMAQHLEKQWTDFDKKGFIKAASKNLDDLELKARSNQITDALIQYLPDDYERAGQIMLQSLGTPLDDDLSCGTVDVNGIAGWAVMPMAHYVGLRGHDHFDLSMTLFKEMTKRSSSEFGIRLFLLEKPKKTLSVLKSWTKDNNHHVRRLISEGTRPRLPWAMQLPMFIEDPSPVIELLERLKDDEEEYVRRSVANNLNDIAKDHPEVVSTIAKRWLVGASNDRKRLINHACRTLIKNGDKKTLQILGYKTPKIKKPKIELKTDRVEFGQNLEFSMTFHSDSKKSQALMIDYIIHHKKANGSLTPKVFKWRKMELPALDSLSLSKKHGIKKVTTRVYYPGIHTLEVIINGVSIGKMDFHLTMSH